MNIQLVGGQYDGQFIDASLNRFGEPPDYLDMPQKFEAPTRVINYDATVPKLFSYVRYKLKIVSDAEWINGGFQSSKDKWHYEYHYEG